MITGQAKAKSRAKLRKTAVQQPNQGFFFLTEIIASAKSKCQLSCYIKMSDSGVALHEMLYD